MMESKLTNAFGISGNGGNDHHGSGVRPPSSRRNTARSHKHKGKHMGKRDTSSNPGPHTHHNGLERQPEACQQTSARRPTQASGDQVFSKFSSAYLPPSRLLLPRFSLGWMRARYRGSIGFLTVFLSIG